MIVSASVVFQSGEHVILSGDPDHRGADTEVPV